MELIVRFGTIPERDTSLIIVSSDVKLSSSSRVIWGIDPNMGRSATWVFILCSKFLADSETSCQFQLATCPLGWRSDQHPVFECSFQDCYSTQMKRIDREMLRQPFP